MGYRVNQSGEIICDTPEEAIALSRLIGATGEPTAKGKAENGSIDSSSRWTDTRFKEFLTTIKGEHQRNFLAELMDNPHGKTDRALRGALGLANNYALAGVVAGLIRTASKLGIGANDLLTKEKLMVGGERQLEYKLANSFRVVADRVGGLKKKSQ